MAGEEVELFESVTLLETGQVRLRVKASDGKTGWISQKSKTGKRLLAAPSWTVTDDDLRSRLAAHFDANGVSILENTVKTLDASAIEGDSFDATYKGGSSLPVVLKNSSRTSTDPLWTAPPGWSDKAGFLSEFGAAKVPVRLPLGTRQLGNIERVTTISDFVREMHSDLGGMVFGNPCAVEADKLLCSLGRQAATSHPKLAKHADLSSPATHLSAGGSGKGLPWHNHDASVSAALVIK